MNILKIILAGNMSSILFVNLREKAGITYSISIDTSFFAQYGCFVILTGVDNDKLVGNNPKGALDIIIDSLNHIKRGNITQDKLDIAKGYLKGTLSLTNDDSLNVANYNGVNLLFDTNEKGVNCKELYKKRYEKITLQEINKVIHKYIDRKCMSSFYIGSDINRQLYNRILSAENKLI